MTEQEVLEEIRSGLSEIEVPGAEGATMDTTWEELDVDSLDLVELVRILEDRYGLEVDDERLEGIKSVRQAVELIVTIGRETGAA